MEPATSMDADRREGEDRRGIERRVSYPIQPMVAQEDRLSALALLERNLDAIGNELDRLFERARPFLREDMLSEADMPVPADASYLETLARRAGIWARRTSDLADRLDV